MKFKQSIFITLAFIYLTVTGCTGDYTKIHSLDMTVSEAPEVHGANTSLAPHSAAWRFTGKVNYNPNEEIYDTLKTKGERTDVTYKMGGTDFSGKIDFLYKLDGFIFGTGLGYKDGFYHHFTLGTNLKHFEFGIFFGLFHQYSDIDYQGSKCHYSLFLFNEKEEECESFTEDQSDFYTTYLLGAYAGLIFDDLFLNYSVSTYKPNILIEEHSPKLIKVVTQYITLGYRISKWFELSAGSSITYTTTPHWYYGWTGGISFYAL